MKTMQDLRVRAWPAALALCVLLPACGGGGGPVEGAGAPPASELAMSSELHAAHPGVDGAGAPAAVTAAGNRPLVPLPPETVDATASGERLLKAVAGLREGGHAVVWMARDTGGQDTAWSVWVQRFDALGRKAGEQVRLAFPQDLPGPQNVAVTVLPEGRIGLTVLTDRIEDTAFAITEVKHWPFTLEGSIDGTVQLLDAERYARFSPRFARLAGPVTAAVGRDGSQFVAWRYQVVGAAPLAPSVRAQRLAADGEPLGWIQRLDGDGVLSRVFEVQITPIDEGGWVVALERVSQAGVRYTSFTQLDIARPLALPLPQDFTHAADAFLLDLRGHGSVLFTRRVDPVTGESGEPLAIHFDRFGQARSPRSLPQLPLCAVALAGGDYLTFESQGERLLARRYGPAGDPVGEPFLTEATPGLLSAGLRRGALALAWVTTAPDGQVQVLSQRLAAPAP